MTDTAQANPACIILRDLFCEGYFALHVESLANHQVAKFNAKIREIKSQPYSQIIDYIEEFEVRNSDTQAASDDLHQELINQI